MNYQAFEKAVLEAGLLPCLSGEDGHWRIRGGNQQIVDVWPNEKLGFYLRVDGQCPKLGTLDEAIELAGPRKKEVRKMPEPPWEEPAIQVGLIRRFWRWLW